VNVTRTRRIWLLALVLGLVAVVVLLLRPREVPADMASVTVAPLRVTVGDEGMTRVRDRYLVTAPVAGRIERITAEAGDSVRRGTIVVQLFPLPLDARGQRQAEAAIEAALDHQRMQEAGLEQARVALVQATHDRARAERLVSGGGIAPAEVERLQLAEASRQRDVEAADFRAKAAAHDVEVARLALSVMGPGTARQSVVLRAPVTGVVLSAPERSERVVNAGETLLELGDPRAIEVVVDLLSTDAVRVSPGDAMFIVGWGGDDTLRARARRIEPSGFTKVSALGVEEQRVNVIGDFERVPPRLGDRFRVEVLVVLWEADSVLQVPASALFRQDSTWAVFAVEGGRARLRRVRVGHQSVQAAEIVEGLERGASVIRHPTDQIADGVRVTPRQR
jgi:HlyD family secretion protein